jgi:cell shape-determining protein MreD
VLTLAGFWAGRYGETTGRDRRVAPLVAVGVITVLAGLFAFVLHYMLGDEVDARHALLTALAPTLLANLILALPVYALVRAIVGESAPGEPSSEVEVVV